MIAYIACPIDQALEDLRQLTASADYVLDRTINLVQFRPEHGWMILPGTRPDPKLQQANLRVVESADLLVALLPSGVPTIGVTLEITHALANRIPVVVYTDLLDHSWSLAWVADQPGVEVVRFSHEDPEASASRLSQVLKDHQARYAVRSNHDDLRGHPEDTENSK